MGFSNEAIEKIAIGAKAQAQTNSSQLSQIMNPSTATAGQAWVADGLGGAGWGAGAGASSAIDVLTADPTGDDLYDGRIWIKQLQESVLIDTVSDATFQLSGAAAGGAYTYKTSPNLKPIDNILVQEIDVRFSTSASGAEHNAGNPLRMRICADSAGVPNESVYLATAMYANTPATNGTGFVATFVFATPIWLVKDTQYHFVIDVPSPTGNTYCQSYLKVGQPTDDAYSMQIYNGSWQAKHEEWLPAYKIVYLD